MKTAHVLIDAADLRMLLARALSTLPPEKVPPTVYDIVDELLDTDHVRIVIQRESPGESAGK
jgi:hypothetical protein